MCQWTVLTCLARQIILWHARLCYACHCMVLCKAPISFPPRIGAAKVQGFRKGDLVDCIDGKIRQSTPTYMGRCQLCSLVCNSRVSAGKGLMVTPLSGILFPPGGKHHCMALRVAAAPPRSPLLITWNWQLIQRAVCLALHAQSGSHPATIATAVCRMPGPGAVVTIIQAEFCSRPSTIASA